MVTGAEMQPLVGGAPPWPPQKPADRGSSVGGNLLGLGGCCCCTCVVLPLLAFIICRLIPVKSQVSPVAVNTMLGGYWRLGIADMPAQQSSIMKGLAMKDLNPDPWQGVKLADKSTLTWGSADAATVAKWMYNVTKVGSIWDKVPEMLRGVFWMKGNGIPEELAILQYGLWSPEARQYLVPMAPFMWAWPNGKPAAAPNGGVLYERWAAFKAADALVSGSVPGLIQPVTMSYGFNEDMTSALLQVHPGNDLTQDIVNIEGLMGLGPSWATGQFRLIEEKAAGAQWKRDIKWGVGGCACIEFGSYTLLKIIDGNGAPLQPYYDEFIAYMGDVQLIVQTGFKS